MSTTSVCVKRVLPAEIGVVFDAWRSAEAMSRWFVVEQGWTAKAHNDFRVGGKYRIEMRRSDGTVFVAFGEYLEIDPPRRLVFTWSSAAPAVQSSRVTIELERAGQGTELTLVHDLLPDTPEGRAHAIGWEGSLASLERYLCHDLDERGARMKRDRSTAKKSAQATNSDDPRFAAVVEAFASNKQVSRGKMFGSVGLQIGGKVFAMLVKGKLVAKLPKTRVDALVSAGAGEYFDPGHGRPMKEWIAVARAKPPWVDLAHEAFDYVKGGKS